MMGKSSYLMHNALSLFLMCHQNFEEDNIFKNFALRKEMKIIQKYTLWSESIVFQIDFKKRFALAVICCLIYHWQEVSH